jgi:murein DD-endopeptidase MepM/ murein hydrolase activator NlpD
MPMQPFPGAGFFHDGQNSPVITAMGQRLVAEGCGRYQVGPGPEWTDVDRQSYSAWQQKLGFSGSDADGIPGRQSWDQLHVPAVGGPSGNGRADSPVPGHGVTTAYNATGPAWILGRHTGADYAANSGTTCVAVLGGSVDREGDDTSFGHFLVLRSGGFDYWYCHLSERLVGSGAPVGAQQAIARVGSTGHASGPHLHFEKRPAGGGFGSDVPPNW